MTRTREQHLAWAKARALEYLDMREPALAAASFTSDLNKHQGLGLTGDQHRELAQLTIDEDIEGIRGFIEGLL